MRILEDGLGSFISSKESPLPEKAMATEIGYRRSEDHVNVSDGVCFRADEVGD